MQRSVLLLNPLGPLWARFPYQFSRNWNIKRDKHILTLNYTTTFARLPPPPLPPPDLKAWDIDTLNINWTSLTAYAYPPTALLHRVSQEIRHCHCLIIVIAPGWPEMPWFWVLGQLSTEIPLQLPVSTTLLKRFHNYVFHMYPQHLNLHTWHLGVDSSKNKASLWRWQREFLPLTGHQQGPSTGQSESYLKNDAEKFGGFLHSICETYLRFLCVPIPRSKLTPLYH